jgi:hypothetical protein
MYESELIALFLFTLAVCFITIAIYSVITKNRSFKQQTEHRQSWLKQYRFFIICSSLSVFVCLCLVGTVWFYNLDSASGDVGQLHAQPLIQALEQYKLDFGSYPTTLAGLVPTYLREVPKPAPRYEFLYGSSPSTNRQVYHLEFILRGTADKWYCFDSQDGKWEVHDSVCPP